VWSVIFIIIPLFIVGYFSFTDASGAFTLDNVIKVGEYIPVILRSILLALIATLICLLLGYPMGYIIARTSGFRQSTLLLLAMLPMWMNFLLRTLALKSIIADSGLINGFLEMVGLPQLSLINNSFAVVVGMVYNFLPYMILPIYSIVTKIDKSVIDAAEDLGGNKYTVFSKVILPLSMPGIISGFTMVFVPSVSTFLISDLLNNKSILIGKLIELRIKGATYDPNLGSAISLVLMVIILISMSIMNKYSSDDEPMLI
jgi:spermidine/putrescine transport system permease protein